jgi:hypothetical protein
MRSSFTLHTIGFEKPHARGADAGGRCTCCTVPKMDVIARGTEDTRQAQIRQGKGVHVTAGDGDKWRQKPSVMVGDGNGA